MSADVRRLHRTIALLYVSVTLYAIGAAIESRGVSRIFQCVVAAIVLIAALVSLADWRHA